MEFGFECMIAEIDENAGGECEQESRGLSANISRQRDRQKTTHNRQPFHSDAGG